MNVILKGVANDFHATVGNSSGAPPSKNFKGAPKSERYLDQRKCRRE